MTKLVITVADDLAELVLDRQRRHGYATPDAAAAVLISEGLAREEDHSAGRTDEELRRLIDEADASGPVEEWNPATARAEVLRRYLARTST